MLRCVHMESNAVAAQECERLLGGLKHPGLVVGRLERDKRRLVLSLFKSLGERGQRNAPVAVARNEAQLRPPRRQPHPASPRGP